MSPPPTLDPIRNGVPKTELEELQIKCNQRTDDSLESTRRMLTLCEKSKEAGIRTLVALNDQGEQLNRIDIGMTRINEDMRQAEKNLKVMEKGCGLCVFPWKKGRGFKEDAATWNGTDDGKVGNNQPRVMDMDRSVPAYGKKWKIPFSQACTRITNDAREEMESNMGQVSTMVGNLRNMAIDMGSEIESQNRQIDRINVRAESNVVRIASANERAGKLLKN